MPLRGHSLLFRLKYTGVFTHSTFDQLEVEGGRACSLRTTKLAFDKGPVLPGVKIWTGHLL